MWDGWWAALVIGLRPIARHRGTCATTEGADPKEGVGEERSLDSARDDGGVVVSMGWLG